MLSSLSKSTSASKCYVSHGVIPNVFDPKQPPSKKRPFATILNQSFTHSVELILPEDLYDLIWHEVEKKTVNLRYAQVIMPLSALLEGEFFNVYIKRGNVLMVSEGRPGVDDLYSLRDGVLRLQVSKALYERSGLSGKPIRDGGRKHLKTRYVSSPIAIEINLRLPSMLHGKKGFERIVWAFKNVLNKAVTWLFHDFDEKVDMNNDESSGHPISQHHPVMRSSSPTITTTREVIVPKITPSHALNTALDFEDWALGTHEWISLVALESPRILSNDQIDPFLCRHTISDDKTISSVIKLKWCGLIPGIWIRSIFIELCTLLAKVPTPNVNSWLTISAHAFHDQAFDGQDGYTILWVPEGREVISDSHTEETGEHSDWQESKRGYVLWEFSNIYDAIV